MDEVKEAFSQWATENTPKAEARKILQKLKADNDIDGLITLLDSDNVHLRRELIWVLNEMEDPRITPALIEALKDDDWEVRNKAAGIIGERCEKGDSRGLPGLIELLGDNILDVRWTAAKALWQTAQKADIDLEKLRTDLTSFIERRRSEDSIGRDLHVATWVYTKMARAIAERKKADMLGEMLDGKIKPPKKGMYRMRRAVNG